MLKRSMQAVMAGFALIGLLGILVYVLPFFNIHYGDSTRQWVADRLATSATTTPPATSTPTPAVVPVMPTPPAMVVVPSTPSAPPAVLTPTASPSVLSTPAPAPSATSAILDRVIAAGVSGDARMAQLRKEFPAVADERRFLLGLTTEQATSLVGHQVVKVLAAGANLSKVDASSADRCSRAGVLVVFATTLNSAGEVTSVTCIGG